MSGEHHDGDMPQVPTFINNVVNKKGSVHVSSFLLMPDESPPSDHCLQRSTWLRSRAGGVIDQFEEVLRFLSKRLESCGSGDSISNEDWGWVSEVGKSESRILSRPSAIISALTYERVDSKGTFHTEWGKG